MNDNEARASGEWKLTLSAWLAAWQDWRLGNNVRFRGWGSGNLNCAIRHQGRCSRQLTQRQRGLLSWSVPTFPARHALLSSGVGFCRCCNDRQPRIEANLGLRMIGWPASAGAKWLVLPENFAFCVTPAWSWSSGRLQRFSGHGMAAFYKSTAGGWISVRPERVLHGASWWAGRPAAGSADYPS